MTAQHNGTTRAFTPLLLGATITLGLGSTLLEASDRQTVNEAGGIGVDQWIPSRSAPCTSSHGAMVLFKDSRSGTSKYRVRTVDEQGQLSPSSIQIEDILEPEHPGFSYYAPELHDNAAGDALISWRSSATGSYVYKAAWLDAQTGTPSSEPGEIEDHDGLFVAPDGTILLVHWDDAVLTGRLYDAQFNALGEHFVLVDETELDFANQINQHEVAFNDDGSFLMSWVGTRLPYFDQVNSRLFDADGMPIGPINEHSEAPELFGTVLVNAVSENGTGFVGWLTEDGFRGQLIDAAGSAIGTPVTMLDAEAAMAMGNPFDADAMGTYQWSVASEQGIARYDATTLAFEDDRTWENSSTQPKMIRFPGADTVLEVWVETGDDLDEDVVGITYSHDGGSIEIDSIGDDVDGADQNLHTVAFNGNGGMVIAWMDKQENADGWIGYQVYQDGAKVGPNQFIEATNGRMFLPQVAINGHGEFVISWIDGPGYQERSLKCQRFDALGQANGGRINLHSEVNELFPDLFSVSGTVRSTKRTMILGDDGNLFATWGMRVVTGGTLGSPQYGRTDMYTKALTSSNSSFSASRHTLLAGRVHGAGQTGPNTARVFYSDSDDEIVRSISFSSDGAASSSTAFFTMSDLSDVVDANIYMDCACDENGVSFSFNEESAEGSNSIVAHYALNGDLLGLDVLEEESSFSLVDINSDGSRMLMIGTGEQLHARQYDADGTPLGDAFPVSSGDSLSYSTSSGPSFQMALDGMQAYLVDTVDSNTDQARDIELAIYSLDPDPCELADFNCDGLINGMDLSYLLGFWGTAQADLDGSGSTDGADLSILLGSWKN